MNDPAIKERYFRARVRAIKKLKDANYEVLPSQDDRFAFIAVRTSEVRFVRVVLDEATPIDISIVKKFPVPPMCVREIWASGYREKDFHIKIV